MTPNTNRELLQLADDLTATVWRLPADERRSVMVAADLLLSRITGLRVL
jgi:hypothetical protein